MKVQPSLKEATWLLQTAGGLPCPWDQFDELILHLKKIKKKKN